MADSMHNDRVDLSPEFGANTDIARRLRAFYRAMEAEPIPERFLDLLEKLDEAERRMSERAKDGN